MKLSKHIEKLEDDNQLEIISRPDTDAAYQALFVIAITFGIALTAVMVAPTPIFFLVNMTVVALIARAINPLEYLNTYSLVATADQLSITTTTYFKKTATQNLSINTIEQVFVKENQDQLAVFMKDGQIISLEGIRHDDVQDLLVIERLLENKMGITDRPVLYYTSAKNQELMIVK